MKVRRDTFWHWKCRDCLYETQRASDNRLPSQGVENAASSGERVVVEVCGSGWRWSTKQRCRAWFSEGEEEKKDHCTAAWERMEAEVNSSKPACENEVEEIFHGGANAPPEQMGRSLSNKFQSGSYALLDKTDRSNCGSEAVLDGKLQCVYLATSGRPDFGSLKNDLVF